MWLIDQIAEQKIIEAIVNGELNDLPGQGQALHMDDDSLVAEELRVANRIMKNSGFLPPEASLRKEIASVDQLLEEAVSEEKQISLNKRMNYLLMQLSVMGVNSSICCDDYYLKKLRARD
jgi:DnaJ-like protein